MIPGTKFEIILKNYDGELHPLTDEPYTATKSNGEAVPLAFTVGYKFEFGGEWYGDYIQFLGEEPGLEDVVEAADLVFQLALESYKALCAGERNVPAHLLKETEVVTKPIKTIESGGTEVSE